MTRILSIFLLLCALPAMAVDRITATITVTNTPADGNTLTVNGDIRTLKTTVATPATQIALTNVVGWQATNIFQQQAAYLYAGPLTLSYSSTNGVKLVANSGNALVVTASGSWCSIVMSTQAVTSMTGVRVPISGEPTATVRTNIASDLAQGLSDYSTTSVAPDSVFGSNFVNLSTAQIVTGAKMFTGANVLSNPAQFFTGGGLSNVALTNITYFQGSNGIIWALVLVNPVLTNGQNYGEPFRSPGGGTASEQFGTSASATTNGALAVGNSTIASDFNATALGSGATASASNSVAVGYSAQAQGVGSIALGQSSYVNVPYGIAIGFSAFCNYSNSITIGPEAGATRDTQIRLGSAAYSVSIPGYLQVDGSVSNTTFSGSVTMQNKFIIPKKSITTLVNSPSVNLVSISTNTFLRLTGPTGAFSIGSFDGGEDGRFFFALNPTGQAMTIVNESGADGTAANRILTTTGADVTISGSQQLTMFIYDPLASRWILGPHN